MQKWFSFKDSNYALPKQSNNTLTSISIKHDSSEATIEAQETPHTQTFLPSIFSWNSHSRIKEWVQTWCNWRHDVTTYAGSAMLSCQDLNGNTNGREYTIGGAWGPRWPWIRFSSTFTLTKLYRLGQRTGRIWV